MYNLNFPMVARVIMVAMVMVVMDRTDRAQKEDSHRTDKR